MVAGFGPVTIDEFQSRHAAFALELDFKQLQRRIDVIVFPATDK
jgi:hypothetical protein